MRIARVVFGLALGLAWAASAPVAVGSEGGGDGSGGLSPIPLTLKDFQTDLALWTVVVFLVLLVVLWKFAWGPLRSGLEKREQGIAEQISQAEQSNQKAQELLRQYEQKLAASQEEVREILDRARRDAESLGRELMEKTRQEAQAEQRRAVEQIDAATAGALKELAEQSSTLAVELAGKILRAELKAEDHARLIGQAVSDFGGQASRKNGTGAK
jgi:F-type H+-transporting ATPase subunit b